MPKRTYQPSKIRRIRKFGYRKRASSLSGRSILKRRRLKKRRKLSK